jgi:hypothetical protein
MIHYTRYLMLALGGLLACTESDPCGEGQIYTEGACEDEPSAPAAVAGAGGGETDANGGETDAGGSSTSDGGGADSGGSAGTGMEPAEAFGAPCRDHSECMAPTDYCAESPFGPAYCTAAGCDEDPNLCPSDWTCFDVGQFAPGEPFVCAQPM